MQNIIEFKNINKSYEDKAVLKNINFSLVRGEFLVIIGQSGSGKTTLLRMINAINCPDSGEVLVNNENIFLKNQKELIDLRRKIGYVIQGDALFEHLNVRENIAYVPKLLKWDKKRIENQILHLLDMLHLSKDFLDKYPSELSGGQRQRVGIARAMCANANLILMDEPFGALDEITRTSLQNELKILHKEQNLSIVFITHDIKEALRLATKIMILNQGVIEYFGDCKDIFIKANSEFSKKLLESYNQNRLN